MAALTYSFHDDAPAAPMRVVDDGIDAYNRAEPALADVAPLNVFARDADGVVVGGAVGRTWGHCCELLQLWVQDAQRRHGVGRELMQRFEQAARSRGCRLVYLDTFSFQAPVFYERLGYATVLATAGYTRGIVKYTMHKHL